jgi:2-aminobenzoate-CoA ligase
LTDTFARDGLPPREQWPELLIEPLGYPARLNCAVELLGGGAPTAPAFITDEETLSYADLTDLVDRICHVLVDDLGLVSGNRVLLRAPNNPMLMACWLAVAKAGGIVVATMPLLRRRELGVIVEHAQIGLALCDDRFLDELDGLCERMVAFSEVRERAAGKPGRFEACDTASDDVVLIAYTSGTSGKPKGTMHFHRDMLAICDTFSRQIVKPRADDVFIGSPPIAFTFGMGGLMTFPLRAGAASILLEQAGPEQLLEAIVRHGATACFTAPTAYRRMLALGADGKVGSLRRCVSAGETLPRSVWDAWFEATGNKLIDGIGATEMLHIFISAADDDIHPGTTGIPVPGFEARVVDDDLQPLGAGEIGRLAVRGPTGCRYLDDPRQLDYVKGGWNLTGDAYLVDDEGYFHYQARADDMIITGGYNIAGPEVEEALQLHASVAECAVVAAPDEARGTIVKAFVVLADGAAPGDGTTKELQDFVKATIAPYKYPRAIEFVDALPRTETGKLQRFRLREGA